VEDLSGILFDALPASVDKPFESGQKARVRDFLYSDAVANRLEFVVILILNLKSIYQDALEKIDGLLHYIESDYDFEN
ncbi:MAG: hypothetical protein ABR574_12810, partial [Cryomorphaceae bacterium]